MPCGASEEWRDKYARLEGPGGQRGQVRAALWQEKQDGVVDRSRCRVEAHDRSLHAGFAVVHHKRPGYLVEPQNHDRRLGGRRRDPGAPRSFEAEDMRRDCNACVEAKRGAVAGHLSDGATTRIPKVPHRGVYPSFM
jgi:hypothetical protein